MPDDVYMKYWVHKVEELWKEVEVLKKRVDTLEAPIASRMELSMAVPKTSPPVEPPAPTHVLGVSQPAAVPQFKPVTTPTASQEDPVISLLKHHGKMNIIDMNSALKELGINESVRDTLFKRMKPFMNKGAVKFDKETQTFFIG
ncbi:MAG: hypothetical protein GOV00_03485 [Candidatus Altiarchaeota archaeon]|nr:hypothetical protein [Candidatus Altiarchaeota archaeon]